MTIQVGHPHECPTFFLCSSFGGVLTCWLVDLLTCFGVFFVNNWWEKVFFCVVFSFLL